MMKVVEMHVRAVVAGEQFKAWMDEQAFSNETLGAALHCSRATVWKWACGRHPVDQVTWLACQYVAGGPKEREARIRAARSIEEAKAQASEIVRSARARAKAV